MLRPAQLSGETGNLCVGTTLRESAMKRAYSPPGTAGVASGVKGPRDEYDAPPDDWFYRNDDRLRDKDNRLRDKDNQRNPYDRQPIEIKWHGSGQRQSSMRQTQSSP